MTSPTNNIDNFSGNDIRIYKQKFKTLILSKEKIGKKFDSIKRRLKTLQQIYNDLVVNNNNELALFGLDTFFFQNSLIQNDFQNIEKDFKLINNRVYCDFYKLHRIILKYIKTEIKCDMVFYDRIFHNFLEAKFPRYNDVEPMKNYDIKIVKSIFDNVCNVLSSLSRLIQKNNKELSELKKKQRTGLEIHNFVLTLQHQNTLIMEQTKLYKKYLSFFLDLHEKYFNRLHGKLAYMRTQMNVDIRFKTMDHLSLNNDFDDKEEYKDDDLDYILMMLPENINKKIMNKYFDHLLVETGDGDDDNEIISVESNN
tara:strand:- start:300 stop:1232 length:933 start_codon:yes stop_codon:yes gene_type:complete